MKVVPEPIEFEWDRGNLNKNKEKHGLENSEIEEVFFDERKKLNKDSLHSEKEERHILIGKTKKQKLLFVAFTIRKRKVRIISARKLNKKEVFLYE